MRLKYIKIDVDDINRRWRRFCARCTVYHIYQGQSRQYAGKFTCVYGIYSVKNNIENETNLTDCTSKIT
jgi:ribosomal protein S27AE